MLLHLALWDVRSPLNSGTEALQHSADLIERILTRRNPTVNPKLVSIHLHDLLRRTDFYQNVALTSLGVAGAGKQ